MHTAKFREKILFIENKNDIHLMSPTCGSVFVSKITLGKVLSRTFVVLLLLGSFFCRSTCMIFFFFFSILSPILKHSSWPPSKRDHVPLCGWNMRTHTASNVCSWRSLSVTQQTQFTQLWSFVTGLSPGCSIHLHGDSVSLTVGVGMCILCSPPIPLPLSNKVIFPHYVVCFHAVPFAKWCF